MTVGFDVTPFLHQEEGQHFERKSLFEGEPGKKRPRDRRAVRDQVAENVVALGSEELTDQKFRALFEAHRHGRVDNARLRKVAGIDTLAASAVLRRLRERQLLESRLAGSATFYELAKRIPSAVADPESELPGSAVHVADRGENLADRGENLGPGSDSGVDRGENLADRGEALAADARSEGGVAPSPVPGAPAFEASVADIVAGLGPRPRAEPLRDAIVRLSELRPFRAAELAQALGLSDVEKLVERHLSPMVAEGRLERTHPDVPTHRDQAYRAAQRKLDL